MGKRMLLLCLLILSALGMGACRVPGPAISPSAPPEAKMAELPGEITHLSFSESNSYFKRVQGYEFSAENGGYTAYFWMANEEEPRSVTVDQAWLDTLTNIVRENEMILWDGFSGSDSMLLDGTHFSITLKFSDGTAVNASGYGRFPDNYGNASTAIDAHFLQLLPEDMRTW